MQAFDKDKECEADASALNALIKMSFKWFWPYFPTTEHFPAALCWCELHSAGWSGLDRRWQQQ